MKKLIAPAILAMLAAAPAMADTFERVKEEAGEALFDAQCRRCHAVDATDPSYGPLLDGIVGRKAGVFEGYDYSEALGGAGFVWTTGALRAWMEDNDAFVPGTKMRHVGITDPTVQDFITSYLATLK
ncbi:MAG: c-type cytochrome [Paracoccaceae bacterium]